MDAQRAEIPEAERCKGRVLVDLRVGLGDCPRRGTRFCILCGESYCFEHIQENCRGAYGRVHDPMCGGCRKRPALRHGLCETCAKASE